MLEYVQSGYNGLKVASGLVQGFFALKSETEKNAAIINIQRHVLDAQRALATADDQHSADTKRISELEAEIVGLKDWSAEKQNYELQNTGQGSLAYRLKEGVQPPQPDHWICPNCYQHGQKSFMKHETIPVGRAKALVCHECGLDIVIHGVRHETPRVITRRPR